MCTELGANFDLKNPKCCFTTENQEKIFIYLDPAHMLELIRNARENRSVIKSSNGEIIDWLYIKKLYELEKKEGLRVGTKLTKRHIDFHNEKMNVRLAAQTLSKSVVDGLTYLKNTNIEFKEAGPTAEFVSYKNNAFDILNSRSRYSKSPFKRAISDETLDDYKINIVQFIEYAKGLQFCDKINVVKSARKTGFIGFIFGLQNVIEM